MVMQQSNPIVRCEPAVTNQPSPEQISRFVEQVRQETPTRESQPRNSEMHRSKSPEVRGSDQLLIEAEKFKAAVAKPTGRDHSYDFDLTELKNWLIQNDDDNFFHLTCYIEPILKERIEQGQFVDLEKLLPRNRYQTMTEEQKMQLVTKNGATYWVPVTSDQKISGVWRWEQAFRIYAAIYSKANPQRSAEIWQYIHVINSAAASYAWENVAYYDFTFRQTDGRETPLVLGQNLYSTLEFGHVYPSESSG